MGLVEWIRVLGFIVLFSMVIAIEKKSRNKFPKTCHEISERWKSK